MSRQLAILTTLPPTGGAEVVAVAPRKRRREGAA